MMPPTSPSQPSRPRPVLSLIIPALEVDRELRRCVDSIRILEPEQARCEILVVVPQRHVESARTLLRDVMVVVETHKSIYGAMNDGVAASHGKYLMFCGKDDILLPQLKETITLLEKQEPSMVFHDVYWGDAGIYSGKPSRWKILIRNLCHQGIIYSRDTHLKHGPYLRKMRVQADHLLNIKILWDDRRLSKSWIYLPKPLAWYSGSGLSSFAQDALFRRLFPAILRRHAGCWVAFGLILVRKIKNIF